MLKPFPPFVASLHVTVRIEPADHQIDGYAVSEKLIEGVRDAAFSAIGSTDWKSFRVNVDKVPPAPEGEGPQAWIDPDVVRPAAEDPVKVLLVAINRELAYQHRKQSGLTLPNLSSSGHQYEQSAWVTVEGTLDVEGLARAIHGLTKR